MHRTKTEVLDLFIDGARRTSDSSDTFEVLDPSSSEVVARAPNATADDIEAAVGAARRALDDAAWRRLAPAERGRLLNAIAQRIAGAKEEFARAESRNNGKPIRESRREIDSVVRTFEFFAGQAEGLRGATIPVGDAHFNFTSREPVGVVGVILPWNSPMLMLSWKVAPALACGNTLVVKPSEETPITALMFAELCSQIGLPAGVVNVVTGRGPITGRGLVVHPGIDAIAFTGHHETGKEIAALAATTLKRVSLELGGKSPNIIFDDADFESAVNAAVVGAFGGQGQSCAAGSRILVHRKIKDRFVQAFMSQALRIRVGIPLDEATQMGPIVSQRQLEKVTALVASAREQGAEVLFGGERMSAAPLNRGLFWAPTGIDKVTPRMRVAQEEIFGPVATFLTFESDEEAVHIANDVIYGLTGAVWTRNVLRAHRVARALNFGTIWINCYKALSPASPYGGFRMSGYGKDNGIEALEHYTRLKSTWIHLNDQISSAYE